MTTSGKKREMDMGFEKIEKEMRRVDYGKKEGIYFRFSFIYVRILGRLWVG